MSVDIHADERLDSHQQRECFRLLPNDGVECAGRCEEPEHGVFCGLLK